MTPPPKNIQAVLPVVCGFHGLIATGRVGVQGIRQSSDELVVLKILLFDERLDGFVEVSLVPIAVAMVPVPVFGEIANRWMPLPRKRIVIVMWTGRRARVGRVDRDSPLLRNGLRGDRRVR